VLDPVDLADVLARWEAGDLGAVASTADVTGVRHDLEAAARAAAAAATAGGADLGSNPIRLSKRRITDLLACERHLLLTADDRSAGEALHLGVLVDVLADHHVTVGAGRPAPEPLELALDLCRAHGEGHAATVGWVDALDRADRATLAERLGEKQQALLGRWPAFRPSWWPRTQEAVAVALADGDVVLAGKADVTVGGPPTGWPVLLVEVKSGTFGREQRDDGLVYALLLALRDGVAPAAVVTVTAEGSVHVEVASATRLEIAAERVGAAIRSAGELAGGRRPIERPGPRCDRCPARATCASALAA
jgi:hypothetical protein